MKWARALGALLVLPMLSACQEEALPRDQWLIVIGTDAVVPQIGDRLLVEIVDEAGAVCSSCRRQFGVDASSWPVTLGLVSDGTPRGVRARLYRAGITGEDGFPSTDRHIDAYAPLPEAVRVTKVGLSLHMACFGVLADPGAGTSCDPDTSASVLARPLDVAEGEPQVATPGTWRLAGPDGCEGVTPPTGMVCVPGGTFLLGSPEVVALVDITSSQPEQLIRLSPFFIDIEELTVGAIRPQVAAGAVPAPIDSSVDAFCTWGRGDELPVNCVSWEGASRMCEALGKRLPTEAEWEYVASNLHRESRFPWLDESADACTQAVIDLQNADETNGRCQPSGAAVAPVAGGSRSDVTLSGVFNLGGNVSEWVMDDFATLSDPACWGPSAALREDAACLVPRPDGYKSIRGGSWRKNPDEMQAFHRNAAADPSASVGLRCVQPL